MLSRLCRLTFPLALVVAFCGPRASADTVYAESMLYEIGNWVDAHNMLGPPDGL
jgi:hypothetical protein